VVHLASDDMVIGAFCSLCEFSLLVSQQNRSYLSLKPVDNTVMQFYQRQSAVQEQTLWKSVKAIVDEQLAKESHQFREQQICDIPTAIEVFVYGVEKVSAIQQRQLEVRLNRGWQMATTRSHVDLEKANKKLQHGIHLVTPVQCNHVNKLFHHH